MTTSTIETIPATDISALRSYGAGARECVHCGRTYPANDVPTIEEGCSEDCPLYWEVVGKQFPDN